MTSPLAETDADPPVADGAVAEPSAAPRAAPAADRRAAQRRERREAILDAVERVLGARGASQATMDEIAEAAEVSKGTLYLYFRSKDDLFVALTHRPLDVVLARFRALMADDAVDGMTLLRRMLDTHAEVIRSHRDQLRMAMASICSDETPAPDAPSVRLYAERIGELRRDYHRALERGMRDGSVRDDLDPRRVAGSLWAATFGACFIRMNSEHYATFVPEGERLFLQSIGEDLVDLLMDGLHPRASGPRASGPLTSGEAR